MVVDLKKWSGGSIQREVEKRIEEAIVNKKYFKNSIKSLAIITNDIMWKVVVGTISKDTKIKKCLKKTTGTSKGKTEEKKCNNSPKEEWKEIMLELF